MQSLQPTKQTPLQKIQQLSTWRYEPSKSQLNLNGCKNEWKQVLSYQNWKLLRRLILESAAGCQIGDAQLSFLAEFSWSNLELLDLSENSIGFGGMEVLLGISWSSLNTLILKKTKIQNPKTPLEPESLISLFNHCTKYNLTTLKHLNLSSHHLGTLGIKLLTRLHIPLLQKIAIEHCWVETEGVRALGKSNWKKISNIDVKNNYYQLDGMASLMLTNWPTLQLFEVGDYRECTKRCLNEPIYLIFLILMQNQHMDVNFDICQNRFKTDKHTVLRCRFNAN